MNEKDIAKLTKAGYKPGLLKFKEVVREKSQTLQEFLYLLLSEYNVQYATVKAADGVKVCNPNKLRSLGDIYLICSYYFPGVRLETVKETLLNFKEDLVGHKCGDIKRRVYVHRKARPGFVQSGKGEKDEFGETIEYKGAEGIYV